MREADKQTVNEIRARLSNARICEPQKTHNDCWTLLKLVDSQALEIERLKQEIKNGTTPKV